METSNYAQDWLTAYAICINVEQLMDDMEKHQAGDYIFTLHLSLHLIVII